LLDTLLLDFDGLLLRSNNRFELLDITEKIVKLVLVFCSHARKE